MIVFEFHYSDGLVTRREFESEKEAQWFAHNEGDHLLEYFIVKTVAG
jgi:hypothetical protein